MDVGDNQLDRGGEMSTPDARLSAAERAALANIEAAAAAEDPHLAARLKGTASSRFKTLPPLVVSYLVGRWHTVLRLRWWGIPTAVVGFVLMVLGISTSGAVSLAGALICAIGLRVLAQMVEDRRKQSPTP
jgi:hypothetical protein